MKIQSREEKELKCVKCLDWIVIATMAMLSIVKIRKILRQKTKARRRTTLIRKLHLYLANVVLSKRFGQKFKRAPKMKKNSHLGKSTNKNEKRSEGSDDKQLVANGKELVSTKMTMICTALTLNLEFQIPIVKMVSIRMTKTAFSLKIKETQLDQIRVKKKARAKPERTKRKERPSQMFHKGQDPARQSSSFFLQGTRKKKTQRIMTCAAYFASTKTKIKSYEAHGKEKKRNWLRLLLGRISNWTPQIVDLQQYSMVLMTASVLIEQIQISKRRQQCAKFCHSKQREERPKSVPVLQKRLLPTLVLKMVLEVEGLLL
mmetsp:Transcript_19009/g.26332  ORF Transcript_19009/g.26332 Transcript_19009/m.26332 type:complete len:317 (+) Transcript_19009:810-1760(+)